jgi:hypothetical protein
VTEAALALLKWMLGQKGDLFGERDIQRGPRLLRHDGDLRRKAIARLIEKFWLSEAVASGVILYRLHPLARHFAKEFKVL